jgi:hypothetical protein
MYECVNEGYREAIDISLCSLTSLFTLFTVDSLQC